MPDINKVIKGLKRCVKDDTNCSKCPYIQNSPFFEGCRFDLMADAIDLLKEQKQIKTYGKLYIVSHKVALEQKSKLEKELYEDICKCLMKNGVLVIHSEENPFDVTYGWKLKGVAQDA